MKSVVFCCSLKGGKISGACTSWLLTYQHRDSSKPAQSYPVISPVSRAPVPVGKVYPEPWLHLSPVNEIWVWVLSMKHKCYIEGKNKLSKHLFTNTQTELILLLMKNK